MRTISFASVAAERKKTAGTIPAAIPPGEFRSRGPLALRRTSGAPSVAKEADEGYGKNISMRDCAPGVLLDEDEVLGHEGTADGMIIRPPFLSWRRRGGGMCPPRRSR